MALLLQGQYEPDVQQRMCGFFASLSEKDQRRFAALEARRIGRGGIEYVAGVLGCSRRTIERGMIELDELPHDPAAGRVRRPGGGRKKKSRPSPNSNAT